MTQSICIGCVELVSFQSYDGLGWRILNSRMLGWVGLKNIPNPTQPNPYTPLEGMCEFQVTQLV